MRNFRIKYSSGERISLVYYKVLFASANSGSWQISEKHSKIHALWTSKGFKFSLSFKLFLEKDIRKVIVLK